MIVEVRLEGKEGHGLGHAVSRSFAAGGELGGSERERAPVQHQSVGPVGVAQMDGGSGAVHHVRLAEKIVAESVGQQQKRGQRTLRNPGPALFPDLGATDYWNSKMEMIRSLGIKVSLFDFMERNATKEERDAGYDIADFLLREETKEAIFNRLITLNPALKTLVETFDLQLVNVEKAPLSATVQHTRKGLFKQ